MNSFFLFFLTSLHCSGRKFRNMICNSECGRSDVRVITWGKRYATHNLCHMMGFRMCYTIHDSNLVTRYASRNYEPDIRLTNKNMGTRFATPDLGKMIVGLENLL